MYNVHYFCSSGTDEQQSERKVLLSQIVNLKEEYQQIKNEKAEEKKRSAEEDINKAKTIRKRAMEARAHEGLKYLCIPFLHKLLYFLYFLLPEAFWGITDIYLFGFRVNKAYKYGYRNIIMYFTRSCKCNHTSIKYMLFSVIFRY